jgi:5'-nucleotidase
MQDGDFGYSSNGTPSDCISLGIRHLVSGPVDLVVSGINQGQNVGWDLTYSGTLSAAMEGAMAGIPSFAISVASDEKETCYDCAAQFAARLAQVLLSSSLPPHTLLNVNVPSGPAEKIVGVEVTRQGIRHYDGKIDKRTDPMGRTYYWLGGDLPQDQLDEGTDVKAVFDGKVSVTPIHLDLTDYGSLDMVKSWNIEAFRFQKPDGQE